MIIYEDILMKKNTDREIDKLDIEQLKKMKRLQRKK